jgi:two-component system phosphate regulon sensor histidine kinase PhoR
MNQRWGSLIAATLALVVALAELVAWIAGTRLHVAASSASPVSVRLGLAAGGLLVVGSLAGWVLWRIAAQWQQSQRAIERLCSLNYRELSEDELPAAVGGEAGGDSLALVRQTLVTLSRQLREAEDVRTALDLRARRGAVEQERLQAVLASLADPALVADEFGQIAAVNAAAEKLLGIPHAASSLAVSQCLRNEPLRELLADTVRRKAPTERTCDVEFAEAHSRPRCYRVTARSYAVRSGTADREAMPNGVVAVFSDISAEREAGRRHAEFVSAVSHEMKAPLAGIKAYVELLADGDVTEEGLRDEFLGVINGQADRLQRLIDNLLNLARIESGVVQVNKECRSLNELLSEALDVVRPAAEAKHITLRADLSPMYLGAFIDRDQMSQAAINLLSNAVKYTPEHGIVTLRSRIIDDKVQFDVEDTGVGIAPADCPKIFQKFYRVRGHEGMAPGTGLGLPLAKSIVEEVHGGTLSVRSEAGRGSTFTVTLASAGTLRREQIAK